MIWWGNVLLLRRFQDLSFEVLRAWKFLYVGPLACSDLIWERECFKVFTTIEQITSVQQNIRYTIHRYIGTVSLFNISTESKSFFWMSISPWFYEWQEVAWSPSVCLAGGPNPRLHRQPSTSFTSPLKKKNTSTLISHHSMSSQIAFLPYFPGKADEPQKHKILWILGSL